MSSQKVGSKKDSKTEMPNPENRTEEELLDLGAILGMQALIERFGEERVNRAAGAVLIGGHGNEKYDLPMLLEMKKLIARRCRTGNQTKRCSASGRRAESRIQERRDNKKAGAQVSRNAQI